MKPFPISQILHEVMERLSGYPCPIAWEIDVRDLVPQAWSRPRPRWDRRARAINYSQMVTLWTRFHNTVWLRSKEKKPLAPLDGPLACVIEFRFKRSAAKRRGMRAAGPEWKATKPDADNLTKGIGDMLEKAGVIVNDSRIALEFVVKLWDEHDGVGIQLWRLGA